MAHAGAASKLRRKLGRKGVKAPDSRTAAGPKGAASKLRKNHLAEKTLREPFGKCPSPLKKAKKAHDAKSMDLTIPGAALVAKDCS